MVIEGIGVRSYLDEEADADVALAVITDYLREHDVLLGAEGLVRATPVHSADGEFVRGWTHRLVRVPQDGET